MSFHINPDHIHRYLYHAVSIEIDAYLRMTTILENRKLASTFPL